MGGKLECYLHGVDPVCFHHLIHVRDGCQMNKPGATLPPGRSHPAEENHLQTVTGILIMDCEKFVGSRKRQREMSGKFREVASDLV